MHTIEYIIESDDNVRFEYIEDEYEPYFQPVWRTGYNSFESISQANPDDIYSANVIRVSNGGSYKYYTRTLIVPWTETSLRVSVIVDGLEESNSFNYEGYNEYIKTRRSGSYIYATVQTNKTNENREGALVLKSNVDSSTSANLKILQEPCHISLNLVSCVIDDGTMKKEIAVSPYGFEYEFDALTEPEDAKKQSLLFTVSAKGYSNRFYVKDVSEYVPEGVIDNTYKYIDGRFYRNLLKPVKGRYVTTYTDALVVDNIGYKQVPYDGAFELSIKNGGKFEVVSYGRVPMQENVFYVITLANYDNIDVTLGIKLSFKENPDNSSLSL